MAQVQVVISKGFKEVDMIVIDDTLGKRLFDELVFISNMIELIPPTAIPLDKVKERIDKLLKESRRNGVVE